MLDTLTGVRARTHVHTVRSAAHAPTEKFVKGNGAQVLDHPIADGWFSLDKMCIVRGCRARAPPTSSVAHRDSAPFDCHCTIAGAAAAGALALFVAFATFRDTMGNCCAIDKYLAASQDKCGRVKYTCLSTGCHMRVTVHVCCSAAFAGTKERDHTPKFPLNVYARRQTQRTVM